MVTMALSDRLPGDRQSASDGPAIGLRLHYCVMVGGRLRAIANRPIRRFGMGAPCSEDHFPCPHFGTKQIALGGEETVTGVHKIGGDGLGDGR